MENMEKYFSRDVCGKNMWSASRAYAPHKFKYFFDKVVDASPQVVTWLREHHNLLWARSKFSADVSVITSITIWWSLGMLGSRSVRTCLYTAWQMLSGKRC
jgi:hypothetical protein